MTDKKLKEEFINSFGEDKWNQEEMLTKLMPIHEELVKYLNIDMIPVVCEEMDEDSRFYFKEQYITISPEMLEKYSDAVKSLVHEVRHQYQVICINDPNTKENPQLVSMWKEDYPKLLDSSLKNNPDAYQKYISNICEIDAHAFSRWYLREKLNLITAYPDPIYDELLVRFANKFYK